MPPLSLLRPERSAHATIRGYLYQTCLGILRWLDLKTTKPWSSRATRISTAFCAPSPSPTAPFFERLPEAFVGWMRVMVSNYQQRAADAGRPADGELLGPILAGLERLGEDG